MTQLNTENADRAIAAADNLLTTAAHTGYNATGETETYIASSNWTKILDGQVIGVNIADSNDAKAAIGGKWADGYQKQFLVFQLTETYAIDRLMLGGTSDADYSIKGASVYIGDQSLTQVLAEGTAPVWTSDGAIVNGVLVELGERIKGQFVIFELTCRANSSYGQCWISELAVAGSSLITTEVLGADDADKLIAPEDNLLSKAVFRATDKTGTTDAAGHCLVSSAIRGSRTLISVVLGCEEVKTETGGTRVESFSETARLFDWGFDNFADRTVLEENELICEVPVALSNEVATVAVHPAYTAEAVLPKDLELAQLQRTVDCVESVDAPVAAGDELGTITISYDGTDYVTVPLLAVADVSASRFLLARKAIGQFFSRTPVKIAAIVLVVLVIAVLVWFRLYGRTRRYGRASSKRYRQHTYHGRRR